MRLLSLAFALLLIPLLALTQNEDQDQAYPSLIYDNHIYKPGVATPLIEINGLELTYPLITLNGGEQLSLHFDELSQEAKIYSYTFIHCNADWTPSDLNKFEYIDGFDDAELYEYEFSRNTLQGFMHYQVNFPNEDMNLTKSGNYLLVVFENDNPNDLVLSRRFCIVDTKAGVDVNFKRSSMAKYFDTHHELKIKVSYKGLRVSNPFEEIKIIVMQNFRWDNAYYDLQPVFVREEQLIYDQEGKIVFPATNEFRFTDFRNLNLLHRTVRSVNLRQDSIQLFGEQIRSFSSYDFYKEANGKFLTGRADARNKHLEADYIDVTFRLVSPSPFTQGDVYVFGALSDWRATDDYKMEYNYQTKFYEKTITLKQGYYNYMYAFKESASDKLSVDFLEGNSFNTENDYQVLVYYHPAGSRYDQLISYKLINSRDE